MRWLKSKRGQMSDAMLTITFLTFSGGLQDAYSYCMRGKVFANAQTGNIVLMSGYFFDGEFQRGLHYLIPVLAFVCGVFVAEQVHMRYKNMKRVHWRQLVVLAEVVLLFIVGLMPESANMAANALTSFACAMQVQSFRKVNGYTIASTMCIGNIRSEIESLSAYLKTHNHKLLDQTYRYLGIILIFALGAGAGFKLAETMASYYLGLLSVTDGQLCPDADPGRRFCTAKGYSRGRLSVWRKKIGALETQNFASALDKYSYI